MQVSAQDIIISIIIIISTIISMRMTAVSMTQLWMQSKLQR
jgi:hypothetical protein